MCKLNNIMSFMICSLIISISATATTTFKNRRSVENENDLQNVDEEVWDGHAPVFSALPDRDQVREWSYCTKDWSYCMKDWSYYNYSSVESFARDSVVRWNDTFYDPLSFKGGANDCLAVAFHLSAEVAVSAAQARNGTIFDVAIVKGNEDYRNMMAQVQQELKGDREVYYTETVWNPDWNWDEWFSLSLYENYYHRINNYLKHGPPSPFTPDRAPVFATILNALRVATEEKLGVRLKYTQTHNFKGIQVSAPWEFNETFIRAIHNAMDTLAPPPHQAWFVGPDTSPRLEWNDHSNDLVDYSGEAGTKMAFKQARAEVAMVEFDSGGRYGDFLCGNGLSDYNDMMMEDMKAAGTWVEPPEPVERYKKRVKWQCENWEECWRAWPWKWQNRYYKHAYYG